MTDPVETPEEIQQRMAAVRRELEQQVAGVFTNARTLADWRHHFREHPLLVCGAAAAIGFLVVPQRRRSMRFVVNYAGEASNDGTIVQPAVQPTEPLPGRPILAALLGLAANLVVKEVAGLAARRGRELLDRFVEAQSRRKSQSGFDPWD
jgi:hypothetical protein